MARSSYQATSFVGGEVSPLAQGRVDQPWYRQALALSLNGVTIEEGAWVRRSGTEVIAPTRWRQYGKLLPFDGSATCSFGMVFTANGNLGGGTPPSTSDGNLQFVTQGSVVFDNTVATITTAVFNGSSVEITVNTAPVSGGWNSGDQVMIVFPDVSSSLYPYPQNLEVGLRNRMLTVLVAIDTTHYTLANDLGVNLANDGSLPGTIPSGALVGAQIGRVLNIATPYTSNTAISSLRAVQAEYQSVILTGGITPQVAQVTTQGTLSTDPTFSFGALTFVDGPYLNPSGDTGTVSALTGTVNFTAATTTPFAATDVGRHLRLFSQPPAWAAGTTYAAGNNVTDVAGAWWTSLINSNLGNTPGQPVELNGVQQLAWAPAPQAGSWAWGKITAYISTSEVTVALDTSIPNMVLQTANGTAIHLFQLGVFSNTPTAGSSTPCFPTCGGWIQGRLWLGGAVNNRFDTTAATDWSGYVSGFNNGVAIFSYTDPWDNVLDSSGMSEVFNNTYTNDIQWFAGEDAGVVIGTLGCEILVFSSATNDPITPTSIDSRIITKFGSLGIEPVKAGMATLFVQKYGRRVIEFLADAFSGKFSGRHLNEWAKHLAAAGVSVLAYQEETFPCVWALMNNGFLAGCTYRRFSRFVNEPPTIAAWQRVMHGRQRLFTSMCVVPGKDGLLDRLFVLTNDPPAPSQPNTQNYFIEIMQPLFDEGDTVLDGWFCDEAPGNGPGSSGYDCGGGNAFIFSPTGGSGGADTTTPNVDNIFPFSSGGAVPAVGASMNLVAEAATYLDGTAALYMLPSFGSPTDETQLSMSVWVASEDFPQQAGALFSSPALSPTEATGHGTIVSSLLGGEFQQFGAGWVKSTGSGSMLATVSTGDDVYPGGSAVEADGGALAGGQTWNNVMISLKSNGNGTVTITAAMNETVLASSVTIGNLANHNDCWPFASQPGAFKAVIGVAQWCIGGNNAAANDYTASYTYGHPAPSQYTIPTLAQLMQSIVSGVPLDTSGLPPWTGRSVGVAKLTAPAVASLTKYLQSLQAQQQAYQNSIVVTGTNVSGGQGNLPVDQPLGAYSGYRGSVAELLIWPGKFIDWTNSANRACVHKNSSVNPGTYVPVSLGPTGSGSTLGAPYVYLSGPPALFPINRVTGKNLTVANGAGLLSSPLTPPGN